jgi:hypothetical protein
MSEDTLFDYAKRIGAVHELQADALKGLGEATHRVLSLMRDGRWYTEIIEASGIREGLRRMRELRGLGCEVERRLKQGTLREFEYRLHTSPAH